MDIQQLNEKYGIVDRIKIIEGAGGLPFIKVDTDKASSLISLYGGQVLSYQPANEPHNLMFLSNVAHYQNGKSIKGGAPVCWPWFGPDPEHRSRPAHGFVRNRHWTLRHTEAAANGNCRVTMGLTDTPETRAIWPHAFDLSLEVTVGDALNLELITRNTDTQALSITQALHTYFCVGDIGNTVITGLEDTDYIDKVDNGLHKRQTGTIRIGKEVDRIYQNITGELSIDDVALARRIRILSGGSRTAVVWNPWEKIAAEMSDLEDDDYQRFVCVETANAGSEVVEIPPGGEYRLTANYRITHDIGLPDAA